MRIISPSFEILAMETGADILKRIEVAGRTCYKSEDKIDDHSAMDFVKKILDSGHYSVIEHAFATVRIICDRGVTHEIVRHRIASYSQESTRYANYAKEKFGNEITIIRPCFWPESSLAYSLWLESMKQAERTYLALIEHGASAQQARSVLPNSLKTEIVITCNMREWRHIFELRCSASAHPQMREIMLPLLRKMYECVPVVFADIYEKFQKDIFSLSFVQAEVQE